MDVEMRSVEREIKRFYRTGASITELITTLGLRL